MSQSVSEGADAPIRDRAGGGEDAECDRQVERGPFFPEVGRGQVHGDPVGRKWKAGVADRGANPLPALAHRRVRKPYGRQRRQRSPVWAFSSMPRLHEVVVQLLKQRYPELQVGGFREAVRKLLQTDPAFNGAGSPGKINRRTARWGMLRPRPPVPKSSRPTSMRLSDSLALRHRVRHISRAISSIYGRIFLPRRTTRSSAIVGVSWPSAAR